MTTYVYIPESAIWTDKVRMIEKKYPVIGGLGGVANWSSQDLTNRTLWLKKEIELIELNKVNQLDYDKAIEALKQEDKNLAELINKVPKDIQELYRVFGGFDKDRSYYPYDKVITFENNKKRIFECYYPEKIKNINPMDETNRPPKWDKTDQSKPYYWIELHPSGQYQPIGLPYDALSIVNRAENALPWMDFTGKLHKSKFWRLAETLPDLTNGDYIDIVDLRGYFTRVFDDGRGVDPNRKVLGYQEGTTSIYDVYFNSSDGEPNNTHNLRTLATTQANLDKYGRSEIFGLDMPKEETMAMTKTDVIYSNNNLLHENWWLIENQVGITRPQNISLYKLINF